MRRSIIQSWSEIYKYCKSLATHGNDFVWHQPSSNRIVSILIFTFQEQGLQHRNQAALITPSFRNGIANALSLLSIKPGVSVFLYIRCIPSILYVWECLDINDINLGCDGIVWERVFRCKESLFCRFDEMKCAESWKMTGGNLLLDVDGPLAPCCTWTWSGRSHKNPGFRAVVWIYTPTGPPSK